MKINILHHTPIDSVPEEHLHVNMQILGVSRLLLQQFARHRKFSLSVKSTRYTSRHLKNCKVCFDSKDTSVIEKAKEFIVMPSEHLFPIKSDHSAFVYEQMKELEIFRKALMTNKADVAKYLLPESYKTNITCTTNIKYLRNFLALRSDVHSHFEIRELAWAIFNVLPFEYQLLTKNCMAKK